MISRTYRDGHETQESGVLTPSLSPKCFWWGRTGGWTVSQTSTPQPRTAASRIHSSQTLTPSRSGQSFAQKGLLAHVTPHHHLTTPQLLSGSWLPNDTAHPCPEESWAGEQEAGQHAKGDRGGEPQPRAGARDGPQCGSGPQTLPGWGVQRPEQPDRPGLLRGWGPWPDGTKRLGSSSLRCSSYTVAPKGFWRLVRELSHPLWQMRIVLVWHTSIPAKGTCMSRLYVWAWTQLWKVGRAPSSCPWRGPWGWRGQAWGVAVVAKLGWGQGLGTSGQDSWAHYEEEARAGCWLSSGSAEISRRKQIKRSPRTPRFQGRVIIFCSKAHLERARRCSVGAWNCVCANGKAGGASEISIKQHWEQLADAVSQGESSWLSLFSLKSMRINSIFKGTHGVKLPFQCLPLRSHSSFHWD